ncbi:MAG: HAD family hydrolase [Sedimentisphaerales bacterium]|nr:HAD family hydrolase [Sedimentisphaerales bacterium]
MPHDNIKAVLFDLGETLLDFGRVNTTRAFLLGARATHAFLRELGQPVAPFPWYAVRNLVRLRAKCLLSNVTRRDFDSLEVFRTVGARKGVELSPSQWEQFAWLWYEPLSRCATVEDDLKRTLGTLRDWGLKLGIVSNTFVNRASLEKHLGLLSILDFFRVQLYSCEFKVRKPNLELFRIAAEKIGVPIRNILFVGDRIDNDIVPAMKSGMKAVLKEAYTNTGKTPPAGAHRIRLLSELPGLIQALNTR